MSEEELELMKQIDEQIEINNKLKKEIEEMDRQIVDHKMSIMEATNTLNNIKRGNIKNEK